MTPKEKFEKMSTKKLQKTLNEYLQQVEFVRPILASNPIMTPIQDWIKLRDATQIKLHDIALINQELRKRAK